jgi:hypothetical protein
LGDGSCLGESGPLVAALLEDGTGPTEAARWSLAMALALLATPGVESAVPLA